MEEEKDILLDAWSRLKIFVYNYPWAWFMIGHYMFFFTKFFYYKRILVAIIIFLFSIINIAANYDKNRSKFKWLFWDCLVSTLFIIMSFLFVLEHINHSWYSLLVSINFFEDKIINFGYCIKSNFAFMGGVGNFIQYLGNNIGKIIFLFWFVFIYRSYKNKDTFKDFFRERTFLMMITLIYFKIFFIIFIFTYP